MFSTLHDPGTLISIGVGFFILIVAALIFVLKNRKRNAANDSVVANAASTASTAGGQVPSASPQGAADGQVVQTSATPQESAESAINYNAMVFTDDSGIKFPTIKQKLLTLVFLDPSMPKSGSRFLCVEKDGQIKGYDPRDSLIASNDTAQRAWRATHCKEIVRAMFQAPTTPWEKLNQVFMWVFCGGLLFLGVIALSRI